jgi:5-formyltetrahydrofolate cyclo-ligase
MSSLFEHKKKLRVTAGMRRRRAAAKGDIGIRLLEQFDRAIVAPAGKVVSGYWPIGDEANAMNLLRALGKRGFEMALPVVPAREQPLTFRRWRADDPMDIGPFGISEPRDAAPVLSPDLILAPLLAYDRAGGRLGYGGGYYDRTIVELRKEKPVIVVGIAYAAQEYDTVPCGNTDVPLDWIVTETDAICVEQYRQ